MQPDDFDSQLDAYVWRGFRDLILWTLVCAVLGWLFAF
jgi:hypothetical protein